MNERSVTENSDASAYLNQRDAAKHLGVSPSYLANARCRNEGPIYVKLGDGVNGRIRYRRSDLDAWMAARAVTPSRPVSARSKKN